LALISQPHGVNKPILPFLCVLPAEGRLRAFARKK